MPRKFDGTIQPIRNIVVVVGLVGACHQPAAAQCSSKAGTPAEASACASHAIPDSKVAVLERGHQYSLAELIDIGERNHPTTRATWERAKQQAKLLGIEKSEYFPVLAATALFADQRTAQPFPKPLSPVGYSVVDLPLIQPQIELQYLIFDFGGRQARVDAAKAEALAAAARFIKTNQDVAFAISNAYYYLVTAQERLQAATDTLRTAKTTQDAAEARLANGRATLPDVLNARAETAQASFDLEQADGDEKIARVTLSEAIGVEPSPDLAIDGQGSGPLPNALALTIDQLIERAFANRPDLMAQMQAIRRADDEIRNVSSAYKPKVTLSANVAQAEVWPSEVRPPAQLGHINTPTWAAAVNVEWTVFDGGARRNRKEIAESGKREAIDELRDKRDQVQREVWSSYIAFRTALRQEDAAVALLSAAGTSYSASLDAYNYGVKNLVDVVTAEKQLALARLSSVSARSRVLAEAVRLESVTGNLLRNQQPATTTQGK
ncbi:MAG TPA: TolC family protein [Bryobacteraceae bacterium]|nr:TolC family protein [Bryobacteraceae bacterium]